jgi:hypothetical protein
MGEPLLDITVPGTPRPKGSLRPVGRHGQKARLVEQLTGSPEWRRTVAAAAHDAICHTPAGHPGYCQPRPVPGHVVTTWPYPGPVAATLILRFTRPKSAPKRVTRPATRSSGDIDKQARNILDALQDAGVIVDDAQVVTLTVHKVFARTGELPGATITITTS